MNLLSKSSLIAVVFYAAMILLTFGSFPGDAAQAPKYYSDVSILIIADDQDVQSTKRSNRYAKHVLTVLQSGMTHAGFHVLVEEAIASDLGWNIRDRRKKTILFRIVKLMSKSGKAEHQIRAMVLYRVFMESTNLDSGLKVEVRIEGEIYDHLSNKIVDSAKPPSLARRVTTQGGECDDTCRSEVNKLVEQAAGLLVDKLGKKLARYIEKGFLDRNYTVTLQYFDQREALAIIGVMADEIPGYKTHTLISQQAVVRKYAYATTAKPNNMEEWLTILLKDMNFNPDKEITFLIKGNEITINKILPTPRRPRSRNEKKFMK